MSVKLKIRYINEIVIKKFQRITGIEERRLRSMN